MAVPQDYCNGWLTLTFDGLILEENWSDPALPGWDTTVSEFERLWSAARGQWYMKAAGLKPWSYLMEYTAMAAQDHACVKGEIEGVEDLARPPFVGYKIGGGYLGGGTKGFGGAHYVMTGRTPTTPVDLAQSNNYWTQTTFWSKDNLQRAYGQYINQTGLPLDTTDTTYLNVDGKVGIYVSYAKDDNSKPWQGYDRDGYGEFYPLWIMHSNEITFTGMPIGWYVAPALPDGDPELAWLTPESGGTAVMDLGYHSVPLPTMIFYDGDPQAAGTEIFRGTPLRCTPSCGFYGGDVWNVNLYVKPPWPPWPPPISIDKGGAVGSMGGCTDFGDPISFRIRPRDIAVAGVGGEAAYYNFYLVADPTSNAAVVVTPKIDDRDLDARPITLVGALDQELRQRFEIPLTERFDQGGAELIRQTARGTWAALEITGQLAWCTGGLVSFLGLELEYDQVRESHPDMVFDPEDLTLLSDTSGPERLALGESSNVAKLFGGPDRSSFVIQPHGLAPSGVGGEAMFYNVYLAISRSNTVQWQLTLTPIVDGVDLVAATITLAALAAGKAVTEIIEVPITEGFDQGAGEVLRYAPRGAWGTFRLEGVVSTPTASEELVLEGATLEVETVRESLEHLER